MKAIATITILLSILSITPVFAGGTKVMEYRQIRLAEFQDRIAEQIVSGNYSAAYCDMTTAYVTFWDIPERPTDAAITAVYELAVSNGQTPDCN